MIGSTTLNSFAPANFTSGLSQRTKLLFSFDQGFGVGAIYANDLVAIDAMAKALKPLQEHYDVFALVNPMIKDKSKLDAALDVLVKNDLPFVLDIYSSDSSALGECVPYLDPVKGTSISMPLKSLSAYKQKYKRYFGGLRVMEILAQDGAYYWLRAGNHALPECDGWINSVPYSDAYVVFKPNVLNEIFDFAVSNNMFVQFADWSWDFDKQDPRQQKYLQDLRNSIARVGGENAPIYLTYDNNALREREGGLNAFWDPARGQADWDKAKRSDWYRWAPGLREMSGLGEKAHIGLSNQSWLCDDEQQCPVENIITWTWGALDQNRAELVQFESAWYFFNLPFPGNPKGPIWQYTRDANYSTQVRGQPRERFLRLKKFLIDRARGVPFEPPKATVITPSPVTTPTPIVTQPPPPPPPAAPYYRSFNVAKDFLHQTGYAAGSGWAVQADGLGRFLLYGPYVTDLPEISLRTDFSLHLDNTTADDLGIVTLQVRDHSTGEILSEATYKRRQLGTPFVSQVYSLSFDMRGRQGHMIEFRVYVAGHSYVRVDGVTVRSQ